MRLDIYYSNSKQHIMEQKSKIQVAAIACMLALCPSVRAQQLVVHTDLGNDAYNLSDIRKILTTEEGVTVGEYGKERKVYDYSQIKKITFSTATSIAAVKTANSNFVARVEEGGKVVSWTGTEAGQEVALFDITGKMLRRESRPARQQMDISALPHGTYILKVGNNNFKFVK